MQIKIFSLFNLDYFCCSQSEMDDYRLSTKTQSLQSITVGQNEAETLNAKLIKAKTPKRKPKTFALPSLTNIAALFIKNWITMKRNILLLLFVFFLPGIVLFINSIAIGQDPKNLPIAFVNQENDCSEKFYLKSCEANLLGCYFQQALNDSSLVSLIPYTNVSQANLDTEKGLVHGSIVVPPNFSVSYLKKILDTWRFNNFLFSYQEDDTDVATDATIDIALDASDPQLSLFMKKAISDSMDELIVNVSRLCEEDLPASGINLKMFTISDPLLGTEDSDYREFITPGMICCGVFFLAMALTSESFITERSQGLLERSWITGVLPIEIIASYIMSQFLVMVMQESPTVTINNELKYHLQKHLQFTLYRVCITDSIEIVQRKVRENDFSYFQAAITLITVFVVFQIPCHGPIAWLVVLTIFQGELIICSNPLCLKQ